MYKKYILYDSSQNYVKLIYERMMVEGRRMVVAIDWDVHKVDFSDARNGLYLDLCGLQDISICNHSSSCPFKIFALYANYFLI